MASQDWFEKDFYAVLGVDKNVSDDDLKKTYRKLARQYHPDQNPGDEAAEKKFKEISEAYAVIGDPEERKEYDAIRAMGSGPRFTGGSSGTGGFEDVFGSMFGGARAGASRAEDIFGNLFGGFGGGQQAGFAAQKGPDQRASVTLGFTQAVRGDTLKLTTGQGKSVTVRVPAGVSDGQKIRLAGQGGTHPGGGPNGDLIVQVAVKPHPVFTRDGTTLRLTVPVTFVEAAFGATIEVPTLDGTTVKVKVAPGTTSGKQLRIGGRGVETKKAKGDLVVTLEVAVPSHLSGAQREALEAFAKASSDESPRDDLLATVRSAA